jgi:AcrR family transcriptional regulator
VSSGKPRATAHRQGAENGKLARGEQLLSPAQLQRARILAATREIVEAQGAGAASVSRILRRAAVSRGTFYAHFSGREDALMTLVEGAIQRSRATVLAAVEHEAGWREQTRRGLESLLSLYEAEPDIGRLCVIHSRHPSAQMQRLRANTLEQLTAHIASGASGPGALSAECTVAGVLGVIEARLQSKRNPRLAGLAGELASFITTPYLGASAARAERARANSDGPPEPASARANGRVAIRITYRTTRVLGAIGARGGLSNLEIASLAGISDQGQISKLLKRLDGAGLIENETPGAHRGATNAWHLTSEGRRLARSVLDPLPGRT